MKSKVFLFISLFLASQALGQMHDLEYFVTRGLANSPLLKDLNNQLIANQIDSELFLANYKPQVSMASDNFYPQVIHGYGYDPAITNGGNYSALINVNQSFIGRKHLNAEFAGLHIMHDSIGNQREISEHDLKRTITAQYITAYGDEQQLKFYNEIHHLLAEEDSILKQLTRSNVYRQSDYLTFLVTVQQQELQIKQLQIQHQTDVAMLNYLCGIFDTVSYALSYPSIKFNINENNSNSIFYRKYELDSLSLNNNLLLLNYSYRPRIAAYANAGYNSSLMYQAEKNFGTGIGLNLSMPIYDGHKRKLQTRKINLQQNSVKNYRNFFKAQYDQQLSMLTQQLASTEKLIDDINSQIRYSEALINVNKKFLSTGDIRISDVIIAINNYLTAKNLLTQNNISRLQIINQINYWNR